MHMESCAEISWYALEQLVWRL